VFAEEHCLGSDIKTAPFAFHYNGLKLMTVPSQIPIE